ncbi:hypothetical protein ACOMHN_059515 [Nucella lapillus]
MHPVPIAVPTALYKDISQVMDVLDSFILSSMIPAVSVIVTAIATLITVISLKRAAAWRGTEAGGRGISQKERALTSMLIAVSSVFIACVSPRVIRSLCRYFIPELQAWGKLCSVMLLTESIINVPLTLNSTVNFFVYFSLGSRFRQTLRQMFAFCVVTSCKKTTKAEIF